VPAHSFHPADFTIRGDGVCSINPEIARRLVDQLHARQVRQTRRAAGNGLSPTVCRVFELIDLYHPEIVAARVEPSDVLLRRQCAPRRAQLQMQLDEHAARIKKLEAADFSK
jgi:hypothetical protein